jgi:hypothetical protein
VYKPALGGGLERDDLVGLVAADPDGARRVIDEHVQQVAAGMGLGGANVSVSLR